MIGETQNTADPEESKAKVALRDAVIVFLLFLVTNLVQAGYPPTVQVVYTAALAGALMSVISYMHALGIKKPEE